MDEDVSPKTDEQREFLKESLTKNDIFSGSVCHTLSHSHGSSLSPHTVTHIRPTNALPPCGNPPPSSPMKCRAAAAPGSPWALPWRRSPRPTAATDRAAWAVHCRASFEETGRRWLQTGGWQPGRLT